MSWYAENILGVSRLLICENCEYEANITTTPEGLLPRNYRACGDSGSINGVQVEHGASILRLFYPRRVDKIVIRYTASAGLFCRGYTLVLLVNTSAGSNIWARSVIFSPTLDQAEDEMQRLTWDIAVLCPVGCERIDSGCAEKTWFWKPYIGGLHSPQATAIYLSRNMMISELFAQIAALYCYYQGKHERFGQDIAILAIILGMTTGHIPTSWLYTADGLALYAPIGPLIGLLTCETR